MGETTDAPKPAAEMSDVDLINEQIDVLRSGPWANQADTPTRIAEEIRALLADRRHAQNYGDASDAAKD